MTSAEIVGTLLAALVLGTINGVVLARAWSMRRARFNEWTTAQFEAYRDWLAAQKVLTRTSLALVAAYRALPSDKQEKDSGDLKQQMFLQTRANWFDAVSALDRAEAALLIWGSDDDTAHRLTDMMRSSKQAVQATLHGETADFNKLVDALHNQDVGAIKLVEDATARIRKRQNGWANGLTRLKGLLDSTVGRWNDRT